MPDMSASVEFSIKYDGPALTSHEMDVRELAPALLALSTLLEESNRTLNSEKPEIRVNVKGNFKSGSFKVDLSAALTFKEQLVSLLAGPDATAMANLFGILSGLGLLGGGGLLGLLLWLKGRKPSSISYDKDKVVFTIQGDDGGNDSLAVDLAVHRLYQESTVRQSLAKVVKPLDREGIDTFTSGRDGEAEVIITKADAPALAAIDDASSIVSDTITDGMLLQIESPSFKDGNKWRLTDGTTSFYAELADMEFVDRIQSGEERFGKGDVLVVKMRRVQSISDNGLKTEYKIEEVKEHRAPLQGRLFMPDPSSRIGARKEPKPK